MCEGSGDVEDGRIWLRVRRGWSQWKGLVEDGTLRPVGGGHLLVRNLKLGL